jgi:hypothetical protein
MILGRLKYIQLNRLLAERGRFEFEIVISNLHSYALHPVVYVTTM